MKFKNPVAMKMKVSFVAIASLSNVIYAAESLDRIVVSTTSPGQQQEIEDVQATVEILDKNTLKSLSGRSVPQVLNEAVGLTIKDSGSTSNVHMRGFYDGHTLILVDGLRRTGKYGNSDLNGIGLEDVERIEIVRGPMSALYGADALAGVVNIITKKPARKDSAQITLIGGQAHNQQRETGIIRTSADIVRKNVSHTIALEVKDRGDYRRDQTATATDLREELKTFISYGNNINLGNDLLQTRIEFWDQDDSGVASSGSATYEQEKRYQFSGIYSHANENYLIDTNLGYGYSDTDVNRGSGSETTEYSQLEFNSYLRHFTTDNITNIFGIGAKREDIEVSMYTRKADRTNYSALYQNEWNITDNLSTVAGLRFDDYSDFGSATNPRLSVKFVHDSTDFRISYGEAFKAPSFTNMYSSFTRGSFPSFNITGNPTLAPEESETYEVAIGHSGKNYRLDLVYHYTNLDNLISSYTAGGAFPVFNITYGNINKAVISGTELGFTLRPVKSLSIKGSVEYLDTEDKATGERLTNSAQVTSKLNFAYVHNSMSYFLNVKSWQDYYASDENRVNVNTDYTVVDAKINFDYDKNIAIFGGIDNIENKEMPYNMQLFGSPNDPGERYFYIGSTIKF